MGWLDACLEQNLHAPCVCLRKTADDHENDESVVDIVKRNLYVDDIIKSVKQPEETLKSKCKRKSQVADKGRILSNEIV